MRGHCLGGTGTLYQRNGDYLDSLKATGKEWPGA